MEFQNPRMEKPTTHIFQTPKNISYSQKVAIVQMQDEEDLNRADVIIIDSNKCCVRCFVSFF